MFLRYTAQSGGDILEFCATVDKLTSLSNAVYDELCDILTKTEDTQSWRANQRRLLDPAEQQAAEDQQR